MERVNPEEEAGDLAKDLLQQGIRGMKIWPFDQFGPTLAGPGKLREPVVIWGATTAAGVLGHSITNDDLKKGVHVFQNVK